jgi:hypothetical protein
MRSTTIEQHLLATHISDNADFEQACISGNAKLIMEIVDTEMQKNNLHTKGSEKLKADIFRMTKGQQRVPSAIGTNILYFVWNSRLSGTGLAVCG